MSSISDSSRTATCCYLYLTQVLSMMNLFDFRRPFFYRHVTGDYDPQLNSSEQGLMPMAEMDNTNSSWKKVLSSSFKLISCQSFIFMG